MSLHHPLNVFADSFSCHLDTPGKRELELSDYRYQIGLWGMLLSAEWCGRAQPTIDGTTPGKVVLGCVRKQAKHRSEEQASVPLWSLLQFLPPGSCPGFSLWRTILQAEINLSSPSCFWTEHFITATENLTKNRCLYNFAFWDMFSLCKPGWPGTH